MADPHAARAGARLAELVEHALDDALGRAAVGELALVQHHLPAARAIERRIGEVAADHRHHLVGRLRHAHGVRAT